MDSSEIREKCKQLWHWLRAIFCFPFKDGPSGLGQLLLGAIAVYAALNTREALNTTIGNAAKEVTALVTSVNAYPVSYKEPVYDFLELVDYNLTFGRKQAVANLVISLPTEEDNLQPGDIYLPKAVDRAALIKYILSENVSKLARDKKLNEVLETEPYKSMPSPFR